MPPLARIVTCYPESVEPIAARLRALGYVIEIISPGETPPDAAALEIRVDGLTLDQAFAYAQSFVESGGNVFVDTRVLQPELPAEPVPSVNAGHESGLSHAAADVILSAADTIRSKHAALMTSLRHARAQRQIRLAEEAKSRQQAQEQMRARETERAKIAQLEAQRQREAALERERLARLEAERRLAEVEAERARLAEVEAEHRRQEQAARVEAERRRREAEQHAQIIPVQVQQQDTPAVPIASPVPPTSEPMVREAQPMPSTPSQPAKVVNQRQPALRRPAGARRVRSGRSVREWGSAAAAAAITTIVLLMAWSVVSHPRPASPLSNRDLMRMPQMEQQLPFGAVTLKPIAPPPARSSNQVAPAASVEHTNSPAHKPSNIRTRRATEHSSEDAVIIRHFAPQQAPVRKRQDTASIKRFSDME